MSEIISKQWRLSSRWAAAARQTIRQRRQSAPFRLLAQISTKYLRAWYNERFFDFSENGEAFALATFMRWKGNKNIVVWDVGANNGGWATEAASILTEATIHSFEIVPPIADDFQRKLGNNPHHLLHRFGLSDSPGQVEVSYNCEHHSTSAINYRDTDEFGTRIEKMICKVETVDRIIASGVPAPALLKIDTEGHDAAVLRGATGLLHGKDAPDMIQFEYGETWLPSGETLEKCHKYLSEAGYQVGRLFPDHVEFKEYSYEDDHYRMGNMIAVRDDRLRRLLAGEALTA